MRSSVSYILSSSASEPNMSHPDFEQYSHDHAALLILVRHLGSQLKPKIFSKLFDRISRLSSVKIIDSAGQTRNIFVRFIREHPVENNEWGDFQTHRRLLGLITLARYDSALEMNEICRVHESLKVKYNITLYDSRCVLFGPSRQTLEGNSFEKFLENNEKSPTPPMSPKSPPSSGSPVTEEEEDDEMVLKFPLPQFFKSRALFYHDHESCDDLEKQTEEFINSLFWVLESKRLEKSREKLEKVSLILAPFEKKDFVGLDMESRSNKKRCIGRMTKHLGDLCLQAGLVTESLTFYYNARETLKAVSDWLWLGAANEGLCTASALVLYPSMQRSTPLQRNASLQEGSPGKRSNSIANTTVEFPRRQVHNTLSPEDISKHYKEAIIHYSKYQNAGIIETEASFKAARIAIEQNHSLEAASFLQNVMYINITLSEQEKIQRLETLSDLYSQLGFQRKAAFCRRLAATRCVSPHNASPNWSQCYSLMLQSFPGYKLNLDPTEMILEKGDIGWSSLQIQLLQEIVVAAKRMGHSALATRHMTFLLQTMWKHLTANDQRDFAMQLQALSSQCEGAPVPLVLDNGIVIPPANLTNIPLCTMFQIKNLQPHLQPRKIEQVKADCGPFLFRPLKYGSMDRRLMKEKSKMDYLWVENDLCEVSLKLINPLPFELKVSNMRLLTSGPVFESIPESIVLPSETPTLVTLNGVPKEFGELEFTGYSTHTLGVKSNCRLKHMKRFLPQYSIEVIPTLPKLDVKTSLPLSATFSTLSNCECNVTSASLSLYNGESTDCVITLTNNSQIPIEMLDVSLQTVLDSALQDQIFSWAPGELEQQLPIAPGKSAKLTVRICATSNFVFSSYVPMELSSGVFGSSHASNSIMTMSAGPSSLPSRLNSPMHGAMTGSYHARRNELTSSFRSSNSGQSSLATTTGCRSPGSLAAPQSTACVMVESQLQFKYSGGSGLTGGYCRISSVYLAVEMVPSLQITNWDVLPAETSNQFYLVLDVANLTSQEMEIYYTPSKNMLIVGHESCRVPIPVDRCPLAKLTKLYIESQTNKLDDGYNLEKICCDHISNLVDLRWNFVNSDTKGRATIKGISLTPNMIDLVRMSPIQWDIFVNDEQMKPQSKVLCALAEPLTLKIVVRNCLERPIKDLVLSIKIYQDYKNGNVNYKMDSRVSITGNQQVEIGSLEPQELETHRCIIMFHTVGDYKAEIECKSDECNFETSINSSGHVWRFIPPLQFLVS